VIDCDIYVYFYLAAAAAVVERDAECAACVCVCILLKCLSMLFKHDSNQDQQILRQFFQGPAGSRP
jgi:hypothetical protein